MQNSFIYCLLLIVYSLYLQYLQLFLSYLLSNFQALNYIYCMHSVLSGLLLPESLRVPFV